MSGTVDTRQLVDGAADAIVVSDAEGRIVLWNAAATRLFGFTEDEALGDTLDLITPERFRPRHWAGYRVTMETGETRYGDTLLRVPALHREGHTLSIAFTVSLLFDAEGRPEQIVAVIRDETERWHAERALKDKLRKLEEAQAAGAEI
ncbi:PAS domain-containing protein [Acidimangrovimonas sediminis]|uniref:PAS domain-containing protein n=1 Tax=Acidimangrovimonas sediminis TaxID=2056283 RepID=UPI000C807C43|nr:PAS domain-containing protein [Acidimangrovimonas sediminis]